jgi:hypothetical protein
MAEQRLLNFDEIQALRAFAKADKELWAKLLAQEPIDDQAFFHFHFTKAPELFEELIQKKFGSEAPRIKRSWVIDVMRVALRAELGLTLERSSRFLSPEQAAEVVAMAKADPEIWPLMQQREREAAAYGRDTREENIAWPQPTIHQLIAEVMRRRFGDDHPYIAPNMEFAKALSVAIEQSN